MEQRGSKQIATRGAVDTSEEDPFAILESWELDNLWPGLESKLGIVKDVESSEDATLKVQICLPYCFRAEYHEGLVERAQILSSADVPKKVSVEIKLPDGIEYQPGDHLAILPVNSWEIVQRVLSRFHLGWDSILNVLSGGAAGLPVEHPISAADLLSGYVELGQLITPKVSLTDHLHVNNTHCCEGVGRIRDAGRRPRNLRFSVPAERWSLCVGCSGEKAHDFGSLREISLNSCDN